MGQKIKDIRDKKNKNVIASAIDRGFNNDRWFVIINVILLTAVIKPSYFTNISIINEIWKMLSLLAFATVLLVYIARMEYSGMWLGCIALYGIIGMSSILQGGSLNGFVRPTMNVLLVVMLFELNKKRQRDFLRIFTYIMSIWLVLNLITIILFPDGLYYTTHLNGTKVVKEKRYWLLGFKNGIGKYALFDMFFIAILEKNNIFNVKKQMFAKKTEQEGISALAFLKNLFKINTVSYSRYFWIMSAVSLMSVLLVQSALSIVVIMLFMLGMLLVPAIKRKKPKIFDVRIFAGIVFILFIVIVFLQKFEFLNFITEGLFGKNGSTFGGRKLIWTNAINRFLESPVFGHGFIAADDYRVFLDYHNASDPHNFYLDLLVKGGIIALLIFVALLVKCFINIRRQQYNRINIINTFFIILLLAMFIAESTSNVLLWLPISYMYMLNTKKYKIGCFKIKI